MLPLLAFIYCLSISTGISTLLFDFCLSMTNFSRVSPAPASPEINRKPSSYLCFVCILEKCFTTGLCPSLILLPNAPENTCSDLFTQRKCIHSHTTVEKRKEMNKCSAKAETHWLTSLSCRGPVHPPCQVYVKHVQTQARIWTKSNGFLNLYTLGTCTHNWNLALQGKSSNVSNFTLRWHILYTLQHSNKNVLFISGWQSWHGFCDNE